MKLSVYLCAAACILVAASCGKRIDPAEYNRRIVQLHNDAYSAMVEIGKSIAVEDEKKVESLRKQGLEAAIKAEEELDKMPACRGNTDLKRAGTELVQFYKRCYETDIPAMQEFYKQLELAGENFDYENRIMELIHISERIDTEERILEIQFEAAQQSFVQEFKMEAGYDVLKKERHHL